MFCMLPLLLLCLPGLQLLCNACFQAYSRSMISLATGMLLC
jgi:hypothetical protein